MSVVQFSNVQDTEIEQDETLRLDEAACIKIKELIDDEGNPGLKLRAFIEGGGCSGFKYGFTFDEDVQEDDLILVQGGVTILVDPMSHMYLQGAVIAFKDDPLKGARFTVENPNASSTCGCGQSFTA
ncbi:iron-sulfur cluster insertion protein ErpA [Pseudomonas luteola]